MAGINWYNQYASDEYNKVHDLLGTAGSGADTLKLALTNTAPNASTHAVRADITELSTAGGYTQGGVTLANTGTVSVLTFTLAAADPSVWTRSGSFPALRYVVLYNDTPTSPADPLIAWWDRGSSLTMANDGDTFAADLGANLFVTTHT